jgi:hypothetical protein
VERHVIEAQLTQLSKTDLDNAVELLAELEEKATNAEADYRIAYGRAYLDGTGSVETRKQLAFLAAEGEFRLWGKAKAAVVRQKESLKALHARVEVGRTLASSARTEAALIRAGVTP